MKITISREAGAVTVDGDTRPVDTSMLASNIEVVFWDTQRAAGLVQFSENTLIEINDRDLDAEVARNRERRANNLPISDEVLFKKIQVHRPPLTILDFSPYQPRFDAWSAYVPPSEDPALAARREKLQEEATADRNETFGTTTVVSFDQIKAMSRADAKTWFDANYTNQAQLMRLVRWIFLFIVRRVL